MLTIAVVEGPRAAEIGHCLRELDRTEQTEVVLRAADHVLPAGIVVGHSTPDTERTSLPLVADVLINAASTPELEIELQDLWERRLLPFAQNLQAGRFASTGAAELLHSERHWPVTASRLMTRLATIFRSHTVVTAQSWEHIGSTSVPGLAAKPIIDLQLGVTSLTMVDAVAGGLHDCGFVDVALSAPGSPGVLSDQPRGVNIDGDAAWEKRLFSSADPGQPAILHIRPLGSPWWRYTLMFRDWLRSHDDRRLEYQQVKENLSAKHRHNPNYDEYTIAKTAWFDSVQPIFETWAEQDAPRPCGGSQW